MVNDIWLKERGQIGPDGIPILWKGEFASPPGSPELNWAYYDTVDGKSYIYDGDSWEQMTQDGNDGSDGISIVWQGDSASAPGSPELNWGYYNTTLFESFIWDGDSWETIAKDGTITISTVNADDTDTINLVSQKTIINVDTASGDKTITIGTNQYDGQELIVNNTGTANRLTVVDSTGGFIKNATVSFGQSARTTVSSGELLNGDFTFVWTIGTDISFQNSWTASPATEDPKIKLKNGVVYIDFNFSTATATSIAVFIAPIGVRPSTDLFGIGRANSITDTIGMAFSIQPDGQFNMNYLIKQTYCGILLEWRNK